jgi:hypothetical protein
MHDHVGQTGVKEIDIYPRRWWREGVASSVNAKDNVEVNQPSTLVFGDL